MEASITSQVAMEDFLNLLTVQLQNQDPIEPVKQEDFIAQLSQFSTLEGIENLNASFGDMLRLEEVSQGMNLVGREIEYQDAFSGDFRSGRVDEFFVDGGAVRVLVNNEPISIDRISGVRT